MIWVLLILVVLCVGYYISTFNGFIRLQNMIEEAFSTMDVYLVKRAELIPNLVNVVKGYAKHETDTLEKVIAARNAAQNASSNADKIEAENNLSNAIRGIFAWSSLMTLKTMLQIHASTITVLSDSTTPRFRAFQAV